jgi:molybdenum ABC transporter molybdate-binding protein
MLSNKIKQLLQGGTAAALLMSSPLVVHAQPAPITIHVAAAANLTVPLAAIISDFQTHYSALNYQVIGTFASSGVLESQINGTCSGCTPNQPGYDLFLSADTEHPQDLIDKYLSLVYAYNTPTTPAKYMIHYVIGELDLYSNTAGVDVSSGLPSGWAKVAIADPSLAPYGVAAQQVLKNFYGITLPSTKVDLYPDITATFNSVYGPPPTPPAELYGFVARSQICNQSSSPVYKPVSHQDIASGPTTYDAIIQGGVEIVHARTTAQQLELTRFVQYLTGQTFTGGPVTPNASAQFTNFCYTISTSPYP